MYAFNPFRLGMGDRVFLHSLLDLGHRLGSIEINPGETERSFHKVDMTVGETRQNQLALRVDDFRRRSAISSNVLRAANGENFVSTDGKRFRPGLFGIDGVDSGIHDQGLRRRHSLSPRAG